MIIFILVLLILDKGDSADRSYVNTRSQDTYRNYGVLESKSEIDSYFLTTSKPRFRIKGNNHTVEKGSSITLPCEIEDLGENTVIWRKGPRQIFVGNIKVRKDLRSSIVGGASLKIEAVDSEYTGSYTCEIEYSETEAPIEITHYLQVLVPPEVTAADGAQQSEGPPFHDVRIVREGENITLSCTASGIPEPTITWTRSRDGGSFDVISNHFTIPNVQRSDAGRYSCIASNGVKYPSSYNFTLKVQHSPVVKSEESPVISGPGAHKAVLNCLVESVPSSTVNWYFNGSLISLSKDMRYRMEQKSNKFSLIIFKVTESDLGSYTCSADNRIGQGETEIVLSGIPFELEILSSSNGQHRHTYNLTWSVKSYSQIFRAVIKKRKLSPDRGSTRISSYSHWERVEVAAPRVYGEEYGSSLNNWAGIHTGPHVWKETYTFVGLESTSEYEVSIRIKNKFGSYESPEKFVFRTSQKDPSSQMIMRTSSSSNWFSSRSAHLLESYLLLILSLLISST